MLQYLLHSQALKTLPLLPKAFYRVIFCLLSKGLASAFLSLCLPYSCLLLAPSPAKLALAAAHLPATTPQKHSAPFQGRAAASPQPLLAALPAQKEKKDIINPLISSTLMFVRGQVQQQSTGDKLLGLFPARRASTVFREAVLYHISPSRTDTGGKLIQNQERDLLEPLDLHKVK